MLLVRLIAGTTGSARPVHKFGRFHRPGGAFRSMLGMRTPTIFSRITNSWTMAQILPATITVPRLIQDAQRSLYVICNPSRNDRVCAPVLRCSPSPTPLRCQAVQVPRR